MASFLKSTTNTVGDGVKQGGQGVTDTATSAGSAINPTQTKDEPSADSPKPSDSAPSAPNPTDSAPSTEAPKESSGGFASGLTKGLGSVGNTLSSGATTVTNPAVEAGKAGGGFLKDTTSAGADIGKSVADTGTNATTGVAGGTADLTGTAVGSIVQTAADTTGKIFQPVASGLKAIEGLQSLGENLEKVNGLPIGAIRQVSTLAIKAVNMSGVVRTYEQYVHVHINLSYLDTYFL